MTIEHIILTIYLLACMVIGLVVARRALVSNDDYWVGGRNIGVSMNALAIMAALASGGSIVGVMGLAYSKGIPFALSLFSGAVIGFPLASVLIAKPLRNFGKYTITDFLAFRFPHPIIRIGVPLVIVFTFTIYIIAQLKAAGITAEGLLGLPYHQGVVLFTIVFIIYVSFGGMLAVTWTDMFQGALMIVIIIGTAFYLTINNDLNNLPLIEATNQSPGLGSLEQQSLTSYIGSFVIWAAAISVVPHIVMRVYSSKDSYSAKLSLNVAILLYSVMILSSLFVIVPMGKILFPDLNDADMVFLRVVETSFPPMVRGLAVAAVIAAVMSTTDALLLACSSAVAHDILGYFLPDLEEGVNNRIRVYSTWSIGLLAMAFAFDPPALITVFYSSAIGILCAGLFVPTVAGIWWKDANTTSGICAFLFGIVTYIFVQFLPGTPALSAILFALPASLGGLIVGNQFGGRVSDNIVESISKLHV
tara:strand:+ start:1870 stop:3294 length:1425 start_codon:yes stop_codon:yes gene_type:complete